MLSVTFTPPPVSSVRVAIFHLRNCSFYAMVQENVEEEIRPPGSQLFPHPVVIGYCQGSECLKRAKRVKQ